MFDEEVMEEDEGVEDDDSVDEDSEVGEEEGRATSGSRRDRSPVVCRASVSLSVFKRFTFWTSFPRPVDQFHSNLA